MKKDIESLVRKYKKLLDSKKQFDTQIVELRTQYQIAQKEYSTSLKKLKDDYDLNSIEEAELKVDELYNEIEVKLNELEQSISEFSNLNC